MQYTLQQAVSAKKPKTLTVEAFLICVMLTGSGCQWIAEAPFREDYAALRSVPVGSTEAQVRAKLGTPAFTHERGTKPDEYCISGRSCTDRPVTGRLLVYVRGKPTGFFFIDPKGQVEFVYVGGA